MSSTTTATTTTENHQDLQDLVYKSPNMIDQLISQELLQLSLKDRSVIEEELHGVSTLAPKETPEFLEASLRALSMELNHLPDESSAAYRESQILPGGTYVNTPGFRLRFLRCELFDAQKAAVRLAKFLDFAVLLFGPVVLHRPMRLIDLSKQEKKWMQNYQILPYRDQSGRAIRAWVGDFAANETTALSLWKVILYVKYCLSDDVETQQRGNILLIWVDSKQLTLPMDWEHFGYSKIMREAAPVRNCSTHWCMPELPLFHPIHIARAGYTLSLGKKKSQMKFHVGNKVELLYKLKSYGIPVEWIPVTETGTIKKAYLKQWMRVQNQREQFRELGNPEQAEALVLCPGSNDFLFQGGTKVRCHPGNARIESLIESRLAEHSYNLAPYEKNALAEAVIVTVRQQGGRFLQWQLEGYWNELTDANLVHSRVAEKIMRLKGNGAAARQLSKSSTMAFRNQDNVKRRKLSGGGGSQQQESGPCICSF